jgi:ATP-dependent helicase/nuclease subunit A
MTASSPNRQNILTPEQRQASDPMRSVWVAASAGSGKTHVLSARILRLLLDGAEPQSILCLTYTKAAATEMATRLFNMLSAWIALDDDALSRELDNLGVDGDDAKLKRKARQLFATALETPGGLKIQTIHAFCERLLQLFPVEAGIAPGFRVMDEEEQHRLIEDALTQSLLSVKPEMVAAWDFLAAQGLRNAEQLQSFALAYLSKGKTALEAMSVYGIIALKEQIRAGLGLPGQGNEEDFFAGINAIVEADYLRWIALIEASPVYDPRAFASDREAQAKLRQILHSQGTARLAALISFHLTEKHERRANLLRKNLAKAVQIEQELKTEQARVDELLVLAKLRRTADASIAAAIAMGEVKAIIESLKRGRGLYDFDDLIERTAMLLSSSVNAQWVLYKLDRGLNHILVDEAQDTSPAQWRIITALAEEFFAGSGQHGAQPRSVFTVGDRKQSIFSFQGADLASFDDTRDWLKEKAEPVGGLLGVDLTVSYRSLGNVLASVDMAFARGGRAREGFGERGQDEREHQPERKEQPGLFEFWPLVTRNAKEEPEYWKTPVDHIAEDHPRRKLARLIALTVKSWIGRRQLHGSARAVGAGDILILVQRRNALFSALIAEMRQHGIPVAGADRLKLSEHIIVADMLALAQAIMLPGDDHSLACVLKGPLMPTPLDDAALTHLAAGRGAMTLRQRLFNDPSQAANAEALRDYEELARQRGPFDFFSQAVQRHMTAILTRLGSEAEDAVRAFLDMALAYEQDEGSSLAGFASWMKGSEVTIKREMEEAQGQLRIMTVHGSKGLEAPIVFLADAADQGNAKDKTKLLWPEPNSGLEGIPVFLPDMEGEPPIISRWKLYHKERSFQENMRLLYVGMTRARDELYVCGSFNAKEPGKESWWKLLEQSITAATGKEFRNRVLLDGTIAHRLGPEDVGVQHKDAEPSGEEPLPDWLLAKAPVSKARLPKTISRSGDAVDLTAARRGIAIHGLLEQLPEWPAAERREKTLKRARRHGLEEGLAERLLAIVEGPETSMFFGPGSKAEVDLCGVLANGESVVGRIDRLGRGEKTFLILDYKSGHRPDGPLMPEHAYVRQLAGYASLLREAHPGHKVRAALLWTQSGELEWIPQEMLEFDHRIVAGAAS